MHISYEEALSIIQEHSAILGTERLPLADCLHYVLAEDFAAPISQPPFPRSPLDGFAFQAADTAAALKTSPVTLTVTDTLYAGDDGTHITVSSGTAVRIMTGAMIPAGADCVLRQEDAVYENGLVRIFTAMAPYENYCPIGEDFKKGDILLKKGTVLDPASVATLASAGRTEALVYKRPAIGILSTGSEIVAPGKPLSPGKIYNSNQFLLAARMQEWNLKVTYMETCADTMEGLTKAMQEAASLCDVLITTGGVSVGDKDLIPAVMDALKGTTYFHGVRIKPGMPMLFGQVLGKPILALSGNPFAAVVDLEVLGRVLLSRMCGDEAYTLPAAHAKAANDFPKKSGIRRFIRSTYDPLTGTVAIPAAQTNGVISSMSGCNCLMDIEGGTPRIQTGDIVKIILL